jgi:ribosomal protein L29
MKNALGAGVTGYQQMSMNEADIDLKKATTVGTTASTLKTEADTIKTAADIGYVLENTKLNKQTQSNLEVQLNKLQQEILNLRATEKYTSAATGKVGAETKNIKENIAPSVDPYWYRDIKKYVPTPSRVENFVKNQYNKYKGKK